MITITKTADSSTPIADLGTSEDFIAQGHGHDGLLEEMLLSAIEIGEAFTGRRFFPATYEIKFGIGDVCRSGDRSGIARWTFEIELAPLAVFTSLALNTLTAAGNQTTRTASAVEVINTDSYPVMVLADNLEDLDLDVEQPFTITADAGFAQGTVPRSISLALKQHVSYMFQNRGDVMSESADAMPEVVKRQYGDYRILRPAYIA